MRFTETMAWVFAVISVVCTAIGYGYDAVVWLAAP